MKKIYKNCSHLKLLDLPRAYPTVCPKFQDWNGNSETVYSYLGEVNFADYFCLDYSAEDLLVKCYLIHLNHE